MASVCCVAGLGAERSVGALEEGVGIRLEPDDFAEPVGSGGSTAGMSHSLAGRRLADRTRVQAAVGGDPVEPGADRGASLEPSEALPGGQQRLLQGVLGVLERAEHPVAVHLQLSTVGLGQLAERVAVAGPRPGDQVGRHTLPPSVTCRAPLVSTPAEPANWAVDGRPLSTRGVSLRRRHLRADSRSGAQKGARDDAEGQGRGDLRSRRRDRRRRRTRLRARGGQVFLTGRHRAPVEPSPRTSFPPADPPRRRRSTRSTSRPWTSISSP